MPNRLRRILFSIPSITAVCLIAFYLLAGYLLIPALAKWQVEKQVPARLGHPVSMGEVRFDPLAFRFEIDDFMLSDPQGRPMFGFRRLLVDFELRSVIDRAWTFAQATLEAPVLELEVDKDGRHNFAALMERLRDDEAPEKSGPLPRLVVRRLALSEGRAAISDRLLDEPVIARVEPLTLEVENLSTLPAGTGRYRFSARTGAGASLEASGELTLDPIAVNGRLALADLEVATLVRALSRLVAIDAPAGTLRFAANYGVSVDADGAVSGGAQDVELELAALSLRAPGAANPLLAIETFALKQGRVDLATREASVGALRIAKGRVGAAVDAGGAIDWAGIVRASPASAASSAASSGASRVPASGSAAPPWRISVADTQVSEIALRLTDAASGSSAEVGSLGLSFAANAELGPSGARAGVDKARLSVADIRLQGAGQALTVPAATIEAEQVTLSAADGRFELALAGPRLAAADGISARQGEDALKLARLSATSSRITLAGAGAGITGEMSDARIATGGVSMRAAAGGGTADLRAFSLSAEKFSLAPAGEGVRLAAVAPLVSISGFAAAQAGERASIEDLSLQSASVTASSGGSGAFELALEGMRSAATRLSMNRGAEAVELGSAALGSESLSIAQSAEQIRLQARGAKASLGGLAANRAGDQVAVREASLEAGSVALALADGPVDASGDGLAATITDAVLHRPAAASELLRLEAASLAGGAMRLRDRTISADRVTLSDARVRAWFDRQGKLNWLSLFADAPAPDSTAEAATASAAAPGTAVQTTAPPEPWRVTVKAIELDRSSVAFEDRRETPPLAVELVSIGARIAGLDTGSATPMQVDLNTTLSSGGEIAASGNVRANPVAADLQVRAAGIALAPAQAYLSKLAKLNLASGTVSSEGRLRYGDSAAAGAKLAYAGSVAVAGLLLEELEPKRPFVSWDSVASRDVVLTLEPNRLDIGELRIERPVSRLIIAEDQTVNLTDVLKKPGDGSPAAGGGRPAGGAAQPAQGASEDPFPVSVARIRVANGVLEFADLSLRPRFGTRMHELAGVITGLSTDPESDAKVQLDARVDKYGSAKIRGEIRVLRPQALTNIEMLFRNLEMTSLSPYVAKFAGYRIAGGRLALDLNYKILDSRLQGEHKIVLSQIQLGEKVESPNALNLPLELAIAVLKDSKGVIDIGLPVSGELSDPKFDYGAVIGKAIGGMIGGVVTAPFRALGALFGTGEEKLDKVGFEPGSDSIAPPERQELEAVANALQERPALRLVVPPTYDAAQDTPALKSRAVRAEIVKRMGVELAPGEDPGPIDAVNPRAQRAIEAAFSERYAPEVFAALKRRALEASGQPGAASPPATVAAPSAKPQPAPPAAPPPAFYRMLAERLIAEEPVSEPVLEQLALRRAEAIVRELIAESGVPAAQVALGEPRDAVGGSEKTVTVQLELEVAK